MARQAQHRHLQSLGALARVVLFPVGPLLRRARVGPAPSSLVSGAFARMVLLLSGALARMVLLLEGDTASVTVEGRGLLLEDTASVTVEGRG